MGKGIGGHHRPYQGRTDEWLTPPTILAALPEFDLDPCAPVNRPWPIARRHYTIEDDGLSKPWEGRVWLNPPYGPATEKWMAKLSRHGNGISLTFARTETAWWFESIWPKADAILFIRNRLHFYSVDGQRAKFNSGGPSVLVAYGSENVAGLENSKIQGKLVKLK